MEPDLQRDACPTERGLDDAIRYAAGTLEDEELEVFEIHLLGCERCQGAVTDAAALAGALVRGPSTRRRRVWVVPVTLAAAAAALLLWPRGDRLEALSRVASPPAFQGTAVRVEGGDGSAVERGMEAYEAGDFGRAARELATVTGTDATAGVTFFLGVARLLSGDAAGAAEALDRVGAEEGAYRAEALFYGAKAWLDLGRAGPALERLEQVPSDDRRVGTWAAALADSVRAAVR